MKKIGILETIFKKPAIKRQVDGYFKTLNAYTPTFTSYQGGVYEMDLTRAAIHSFATACAKLKPEIQGNAYKNLQNTLQFKPNPYMDTYKFLYRLATILSVDNNAFIVPLYSDDFGTISGYYPIAPSRCELVSVGDAPYLRYTFRNGQKVAIEFERVGILNNFQYKDDVFGEDNTALYPLMQLLSTQNQGIVEGVKTSANIRFLAKLATNSRPEDIEAERKRFVASNLSYENNGGVMLFDQKYDDIKQINSNQFIVNAEQMRVIQENVNSYFGVPIEIIQNKFNEDTWNAFYEGKIEPFALQLSLVMSNLTFSQKEIAFGNQIIFTANRLQYASNGTKLQVSTQLFDRGVLTTNQVMDIWNLAHVEDGDVRYIRKEYTEVSKLDDNTGQAVSTISNEGVAGDGV